MTEGGRIMSNRFVHVLAIASGALALAACDQLGGAGNKAGDASAKPTIALTAAGPEGCTILLNGAPVTQTALRDDLTTRRAAWRRAMEGYLVNTDIPTPFPDVDAPADMRFACVGRALTAIYDAEMTSFQLGRTGVGERLNLMSSNIGGLAPSDLIRIAGDGSLTWNGQPTDLAAIRQRAEPWSRGQGFPLLLIVAPAPEATVGQVYEVLHLMRTVQPTLVPPGAAIPEAAAAPAVPANEAAAR